MTNALNLNPSAFPLSEKKGRGGKRRPYRLVTSAVWSAQLTMRNRRRNLTARDLRRPLKYFRSNE